MDLHLYGQRTRSSSPVPVSSRLFYGVLDVTVPGTNDFANIARWLVPQHRGGRRSWVEIDQGKWHKRYTRAQYGELMTPCSLWKLQSFEGCALYIASNSETSIDSATAIFSIASIDTDVAQFSTLEM
jgi:hypothetical protein